ncbi:MAG: sigma-54-dependent Fis family transcriptional regulator [Deltaproteobacteria bacterium]|nr:sigma-54-dependent Fis family transcriptional regulator [Deltaproteobacteria bacterium]
MASILLIDDQDRTLALCQRALPQHRYLGPARHWEEASAQLARGGVDLVLLDVHFDIDAEHLLGWSEGMSASALERLRRRQGLEILARLRRAHSELPVVVMTSQEELPLGPGDRIEEEDYTYFLDDDYLDASSLEVMIAGALSASLAEEVDGPIYWGRSRQLARLRRRLDVWSRGALPVMLLGPTGTGKSLVARHFVHPRSGREGPFVSVDLSTLPRDLMAAHLFGSVRGAWTGALTDRVGAFEAARGGTLFLDEVANLSDDAQKLLLSVLQEGLITRLGDTRERQVDVKLVVATHEDLAARVSEGTFRQDLYMRLNPAAAVVLPPLVERGLDWGRLVRFAGERALARPALAGLIDSYRRLAGVDGEGASLVVGGAPPEGSGTLMFYLSHRAMRELRRHTWPGNLRELTMAVENALLFTLAEHLELAGRGPSVLQVRPKTVRELLRLEQRGVGAPSSGGRALQVVVQAEDGLNRVSQSLERQVFLQLYSEEDGDFARMAQVLLGDGTHARKVQLRFNQLGLKVRDLKAGR